MEISHRPFKFLFLFTLVLVSCSTNRTEITQGSETTNGVQFTVETSSIKGTTSPQASLYLYVYNHTPFTPGHADSTNSDNTGSFQFDSIPPGEYNLFVYPQTDTLAALVQGIPVGLSWGVNDDDSVFFDKTTTISGIVRRNDSLQPGVAIFISGSPFYSETDENAFFTFSNLPAGVYTIIADTQIRNEPQTYADTLSVDTRGEYDPDNMIDLILH